MQLFVLDNLRSTLVVPSGVDKPLPWEFKESKEAGPEEKSRRVMWYSYPHTRHYFYSGCSACCPSDRLTVKNGRSCDKMFALVLDYDLDDGAAEISDADRESVADDLPVKPTAISRTFSGGVRLLYGFSQPVKMPVQESLKDFYRYFADMLVRKLQLTDIYEHLAAHLDGSYKKYTQYYEIGSRWKYTGEYLKRELLASYYKDAISEMCGKEAKQFQRIPEDELKAVIDEVSSKTGVAWGGEYAYHSRGRRFWSPGATDETGAELVAEGVISYSGGQGGVFLGWKDILSPNALSPYMVDPIDQIVYDCVFYAGNIYYLNEVNRSYERLSVHDFEIYAEKHYSIKKEKGKVSPLRGALAKLITEKTVDEVGEYIYEDQGIIRANGKTCLNKSQYKAYQPSEEALSLSAAQLAERIPVTTEFINGLFPSRDVRSLVMHYIADGYRSAYNRSYRAARILMVGGGTGIGKTFLGVILAKLFVRVAKPFTTMLNSNFNGDEYTCPLWLMNDEVSAGMDEVRTNQFLERLKNISAEQLHRVNLKHEKPYETRWTGRLYITFNDDVSGLSLIGNLTNSIRDKLIIVRGQAPADMSDFVLERNNRENVSVILDDELQYFAAYLLKMQFSGLYTDARFGVRHYIDPVLEGRLIRKGTTGMLLNCMLDAFVTESCSDFTKKTWAGYVSNIVRLVERESSPSLKRVLERNMTIDSQIECICEYFENRTTTGIAPWIRKAKEGELIEGVLITPDRGAYYVVNFESLNSYYIESYGISQLNIKRKESIL